MPPWAVYPIPSLPFSFPSRLPDAAFYLCPSCACRLGLEEVPRLPCVAVPVLYLYSPLVLSPPKDKLGQLTSLPSHKYQTSEVLDGSRGVVGKH
jgi:hypothetical protein